MQDTKPIKWLRLRDVADLTGYSRETVRQAVINGDLKASRRGNRGMYHVLEAEAYRFAASLEVQVA